MKRYPYQFYIQPQTETKQGSDSVFVDDATKEPVVFSGSITESTMAFREVQGDISRTTHTIHSRPIALNLQVGMTVHKSDDQTKYELLFFRNGQKAAKLWVAYSF